MQMQLIGFILFTLIPSLLSSISFDKQLSQLPWFSSLPFNHTLIRQGRKWMASINPSTNISVLAIPGTHDSCTYNFIGETSTKKKIIEFFTKTQQWTLYDQLTAGIRYIDIRVGTDGNIYHGVIQTVYTFRTVFQNVSIFLANNPTEAIIMRIQKLDKSSCKGEECIKKSIYSLLDEDEYRKILYLSPEVPLLKDIIGKVFIIIEELDYHNAMNWNSTSIELQDDFRMFGEPNRQIIKKQQAISEYLVKGKEKKYFIINHCSGSGGPLLSLKTIAMNENKIPFNDTGYSGIIIMDFPSEKVIQHIIDQNKENFKNIKSQRVSDKMKSKHIS